MAVNVSRVEAVVMPLLDMPVVADVGICRGRIVPIPGALARRVVVGVRLPVAPDLAMTGAAVEDRDRAGGILHGGEGLAGVAIAVDKRSARAGPDIAAKV